MSPFRQGIRCLFFLFAAVAVPAQAELVISIGSTTIGEGGTGSIAVDISNTGPSAIPFNNYAFQLVITPDPGVLTQLAFSSPTSQQLGYLTDPSLSPRYVFLGDSVAAESPAFIGGTALTTYPNDTFNAADSTLSGDPATILSGQTLLLAILPISTATQLAPQTGDSFTVSLFPSSGSGSMGTFPGLNPTYFDIVDFDPTSPTFGQELSAAPFRGIGGRVTIGQSSVPEPSSLVVAASSMAIGLGVALWRRRPRRNRHRCHGKVGCAGGTSGPAASGDR